MPFSPKISVKMIGSNLSLFNFIQLTKSLAQFLVSAVMVSWINSTKIRGILHLRILLQGQLTIMMSEAKNASNNTELAVEYL